MAMPLRACATRASSTNSRSIKKWQRQNASHDAAASNGFRENDQTRTQQLQDFDRLARQTSDSHVATRSSDFSEHRLRDGAPSVWGLVTDDEFPFAPIRQEYF